MTSPNTGLRRSALVVLAVGAALGASACGSGQVSQTASQIAAVDGGSGTAGDLSVNDFQVLIPRDGGEVRVGFAVSYTGYGFEDPIGIASAEVDGMPVELDDTRPMERGCSIIFDANPDAAPMPPAADVCLEHATALLPGGESLHIGTSVPATISFSNGEQIELDAAVMAETIEIGEYTRPAETAAPSEGH